MGRSYPLGYNQQQPPQSQYNQQQPQQNLYNNPQNPPQAQYNQNPPQNQFNQPPYPQPQNNNLDQKQIQPQQQQQQPPYNNPQNNQNPQPPIENENYKRHKPDFSVDPNFVEYIRGNGIDKNEYDKIVGAAQKAYKEGKHDKQTLSFKSGRDIKNSLGGHWFVFVSEKGKKFDFSLSTVASNDYLTFSIGNTMFQVCRLKE